MVRLLPLIVRCHSPVILRLMSELFAQHHAVGCVGRRRDLTPFILEELKALLFEVGNNARSIAGHTWQHALYGVRPRGILLVVTTA